jgi:hypothetical protein
MECAILIKTKDFGLVSINIGNNYSDANVKTGLALFTGYSITDFVCLVASMGYGIYGIRERKPKFPIRRWLKGGAKFTDYVHTFQVKYIHTF